MTKAYCPFLAQLMGGHVKALTVSLLIGLGVGGAFGCSSDEEQPEEAVKTEAGAGSDAAAAPEGSSETADAAESSSDELSDDPAKPVEQSADGAAAASDMQASQDAGDSVAPQLPSEQDSDAMLKDAEAQAPMQETAEMTPPPAANTEVPLQAAPVVEKKSAKQAKFVPVSTQANAAGMGTYIVQPGDTLAAIAGTVYGPGGSWQSMAALNNLSAPYRIYPGDEIKFEPTNEKSKAYAQGKGNDAQSITVKSGDTLSSIAQGLYGNAGHWKVLFAHNKDKIQDPNRIEVGMVLSYIANGTASIDAETKAAPGQSNLKKKKKSAAVEIPGKTPKKTAGKTKKPPVGNKVKPAH